MILTQLIRFCMVGTIGFLVDAAILWLCHEILGWGPILARAPSFAAAVLVTWQLNRLFTFRAREARFLSSFPAYITANAIGLVINVGVYTLLVGFSSFFAAAPLAALAAGSIAALFFNFFSTRRFAFGADARRTS